MDEGSVSIIETGTDNKEVYKLLDVFVKENLTKFQFASLCEGNLRERLWNAVASRISEPSLSAIALQTLRILSRDKTGLNGLLTQEIIVKITNHITATEADGYNVVEECLKCLCNLVFNSATAQRLCSTAATMLPIINRTKIYNNSCVPANVKFFDMRLLFLITAFSADCRPVLRTELNGAVLLIDVLKSHTDKELLKIDEADLVCEVLKTLFNLVYTSTSSTIDTQELDMCKQLTTVMRKLLLCKVKTAEKRTELTTHCVNLLTALPSSCYTVLLSPSNETTIVSYEDQDISAVAVMLKYLNIQLEHPDKANSLKESLTPIVAVLTKGCREVRVMRKYLKKEVLPPLCDITQRPEEGSSIRNRLVALFTTSCTDTKHLVAEFLFVLCKENVARLVKYCGYGNSAGLLAARGLMLGGRGEGEYSSDSESDTEEYRQMKHLVNPIKGCYEEPKPSPLANMTEEQKEHEAMKLVNALDRMNRKGIIQPAKLGEDGRPVPVDHVLEMIAENKQPDTENKTE